MNPQVMAAGAIAVTRSCTPNQLTVADLQPGLYPENGNLRPLLIRVQATR